MKCIAMVCLNGLRISIEMYYWKYDIKILLYVNLLRKDKGLIGSYLWCYRCKWIKINTNLSQLNEEGTIIVDDLDELWTMNFRR